LSYNNPELNAVFYLAAVRRFNPFTGHILWDSLSRKQIELLIHYVDIGTISREVILEYMSEDSLQSGSCDARIKRALDEVALPSLQAAKE
jgi:hypothetical protein